MYLFVERGKQGEREWEKHQCEVASCVLSTGDLACNLRMCPDWESNWWPLGLQVGTQSTEPHQPGLYYFKDYLTSPWSDKVIIRPYHSVLLFQSIVNNISNIMLNFSGPRVKINYFSIKKYIGLYKSNNLFNKLFSVFFRNGKLKSIFIFTTEFLN